jgi:hypothetical protein
MSISCTLSLLGFSLSEDCMRGLDARNRPIALFDERAYDPCAAWIQDDSAMALRHIVIGTRESISGTVYGGIVLLTSLTASAAAYTNDLWRLCVAVTVSVLVFWIAHLYSDALGESITRGRRLTLGDVRDIAVHEVAIPLAAVGPLFVLLIGALGLLDHDTAIWLALGVGVLTLGAQGVRYAQLERLGPMATTWAVVANLSLGLVIVIAKLLVLH